MGAQVLTRALNADTQGSSNKKQRGGGSIVCVVNNICGMHIAHSSRIYSRLHVARNVHVARGAQYALHNGACRAPYARNAKKIS